MADIIHPLLKITLFAILQYRVQPGMWLVNREECILSFQGLWKKCVFVWLDLTLYLSCILFWQLGVYRLQFIQWMRKRTQEQLCNNNFLSKIKKLTSKLSFKRFKQYNFKFTQYKKKTRTKAELLLKSITPLIWNHI